MEFRDVLARRRMHRAFLPDPIPQDTIDRIVRTIRRAPGAGYSQGQSLVVVTDAATRREIARRSGEESYVAAGSAPFMSTAPLHIVPCVSEERYHQRYQKADKLAQTGGEEIRWPVPYWWIDAGAVLMLLLLAAIDEGLAATFWGEPEHDAWLAELLGLAAGVIPIGVVAVGKPAPDPLADRGTSRFREARRAEAELIHRERWGGR